MSNVILRNAAKFTFLTLLALCLVFSGTAWGNETLVLTPSEKIFETPRHAANWGLGDEYNLLSVISAPSGWAALEVDDVSVGNVYRDGVLQEHLKAYFRIDNYFYFDENGAHIETDDPALFAARVHGPGPFLLLNDGYYTVEIEAPGLGLATAVFVVKVGKYDDPNDPAKGTGNEVGGNNYVTNLTENHHHRKSSGCNTAGLVSMALLLVLPMFFRRNKK